MPDWILLIVMLSSIPLGVIIAFCQSSNKKKEDDNKVVDKMRDISETLKEAKKNELTKPSPTPQSVVKRNPIEEMVKQGTGQSKTANLFETKNGGQKETK